MDPKIVDTSNSAQLYFFLQKIMHYYNIEEEQIEKKCGEK